MRITGRIIKVIAFSAVFAVIIFLLWRIFSSGVPNEMKSLTVNDGVVAAYEAGDGALYMFKQNPQKTTNAERNRGFFTVCDYVIIPEANQIQVVYRYTNGAIVSLVENGKVAETPKEDEHIFDTSLLVIRDLTPENTADNAGLSEGTVDYTRISPSDSKRMQKDLYNYYRLVFDLNGTDLSVKDLEGGNDLLAIYFDIYYAGDVDESGSITATDPETGEEELAYGSLPIYTKGMENRRVFPSGKDVKAIKERLQG